MRAPRSWGAAERRRGARCGGAAALVGLLGVGCIFADDPENHPPLEVDPVVAIYDYGVAVVSTGNVVASGCVTPKNSSSFDEALILEIPLEQELVFEYRLTGQRKGAVSEETPGDYFCTVGPTDEVGQPLHRNPQCYVADRPEIFKVLSYELIGIDGGTVDWEAEDDEVLQALGMRVRIVQHDYGVVGVRADNPPCGDGNFVGFYTAVPPEEEE